MHPKLKTAFLWFACVWLIGAATLSNAQSYPPEWSSTSTYVAYDLVQENANWYRCIKNTGLGSNPQTDPVHWELN
jgi:hypothetical protein